MAIETREQAYGYSAKRLASQSRRKIQTIRKLLADIGSEWTDIDNSVVNAADELRDRLNVDAFETALDNAIVYAKQEPGT